MFNKAKKKEKIPLSSLSGKIVKVMQLSRALRHTFIKYCSFNIVYRCFDSYDFRIRFSQFRDPENFSGLEVFLIPKIFLP